MSIQSSGDRERDASRVMRVINALALMEDMCSEDHQHSVQLVSVKLKLGDPGNAQTLVVFTGVDSEGGNVVGFSGGFYPVEALVEGINRIRNGKMRWRIDEYR